MGSSSDRRPTALELFAGAGGLALGVEKAGFAHLAANEKDAEACATLRRNREWKILEQDSATVDWTAWSGRVDLLAGGAPCQPEGDTKELFRVVLCTALQELIDEELTATIGAAPHERTETRFEPAQRVAVQDAVHPGWRCGAAHSQGPGGVVLRLVATRGQRSRMRPQKEGAAPFKAWGRPRRETRHGSCTSMADRPPGQRQGHCLRSDLCCSR